MMSFQPAGARIALMLGNPDALPYFSCGPLPQPKNPAQSAIM